MRFPVFKVKKIDEIKELKLYREFDVPRVDKLKLLRYIAACYDLKSDLITVTKIEKRKAEAVRLADFPKEKNKLKPPYDEVVTLSGRIGTLTARAIMKYCRLQNDLDAVQLFTYEEALYKQNESLLSNSDPKEVGNIIGNINSLSKAINEIRLRFLVGDDSESTSKALLDYVMNEQLNLSPEEIAIKDETAEWSPYGNYKKEYYKEADLDSVEKEELQKLLTNDTDEARAHFTALGLDAEQIINEHKKWRNM